MARLAFMAQGDHAALDAAIDACLARTECTLYTRWRAVSFLVRVRYEDQPTPGSADPCGRRRRERQQWLGPGELPGPKTRRPAVVAVVLGVAFVDERLSWNLVVGTALVLLGVWIAEHNPEARGAAASDTLVPSGDGEAEVRERIR